MNSSDYIDLNKFDLQIESLNNIFDGKKCYIDKGAVVEQGKLVLLINLHGSSILDDFF